MGYVKAAEDVSGAAGVPFPELPRTLVWPNDWTSRSMALRKNSGAMLTSALRASVDLTALVHFVYSCSSVPAQGFEPR